MSFEAVQQFANNNTFWLLPITLLLGYLLYRGFKFVLARASYSIALRTETVYDDLFVDQLQPFRFAWLLPLLLIYFLSNLLFSALPWVKITALVLSIWFLADLLLAILNGINDVYKHNPRYTGASVAGYIGILKVLVVVGGIVLTISLLFEVEPVTLLSGVGAWLAVLLLIFRDTIISFLASIQISTQQLVKEGDSVDVPAFGASGTVTEIDLQSITVQNYDNTVTIIPTSKIVETGFKNYRVMIESGSRRLKRSILMDVNSIIFCDDALKESLSKDPNINEKIGEMLQDTTTQYTNLQLFMKYTEGFLKKRRDVRQRRYPFVLRVLEHTSEGLPFEVYIFIKAGSWDKFEEIQAEIFLHLLAVLPKFELKAYQV